MVQSSKDKVGEFVKHWSDKNLQIKIIASKKVASFSITMSMWYCQLLVASTDYAHTISKFFVAQIQIQITIPNNRKSSFGQKVTTLRHWISPLNPWVWF